MVPVNSAGPIGLLGAQLLLMFVWSEGMGSPLKRRKG
jgi:hypothetical protein